MRSQLELQQLLERRGFAVAQGWAVNCLGHAPAVVVDALTAQASRLITPSPAYPNEPSFRLAERLTRHSAFQRVFFCNSGAEANEGAIKLARKWGRRVKAGAFEIITFEGGFHGRTLPPRPWSSGHHRRQVGRALAVPRPGQEC